MYSGPRHIFFRSRIWAVMRKRAPAFRRTSGGGKQFVGSVNELFGIERLADGDDCSSGELRVLADGETAVSLTPVFAVDGNNAFVGKCFANALREAFAYPIEIGSLGKVEKRENQERLGRRRRRWRTATDSPARENDSYSQSNRTGKLDSRTKQNRLQGGKGGNDRDGPTVQFYLLPAPWKRKTENELGVCAAKPYFVDRLFRHCRCCSERKWTRISKGRIRLYRRFDGVFPRLITAVLSLTSIL